MEQQKKEEEKAIPPTVSPYAEARKSGVHGFGLFATQNIPRDTRIIDYIGPKIKESQWRCLSWEDMCYTHRLDEEWLIDGSVSYNTARFINHSCDPNCSSDVWSEKGRIFIYSNRLILQGEELSYDYGYPPPRNVEELEKGERKCYCGSSNCVGYMVGRMYHEELAALKKELERKQRDAAFSQRRLH